MRRRWGLACSLLVLAACQSLTSLSDIEIQAKPDAGRDAAADAPAPAIERTLNAATEAVSVEPTCVVADGAECDLTKQCGCEPGQHCQARTSLLRATCVEPGQSKPWSSCQHPRECPRGQTCDRGSCRNYCHSDSDCDGGSCFAIESSEPAAESGIDVCWKKCQPKQADACAAGTACRSVATPDGASGPYCVAPDDPCLSEEDGICDDSSGTRKCADGTDHKDCNCTPTLSGAACDPIKQCGCAKGLTCDLQSQDKNLSDDNVPTLTGVCAPAGKKALYAECADAEECKAGLTCDLSLRICTNVCASDADCVNGGCKRIPNKDEPHIGLCSPHCDRATNAPCSSATVCATFSERWAFTFATPGDYCWQPVQSSCPTDQGCDEPQGSGICVAGIDPTDC